MGMESNNSKLAGSRLRMLIVTRVAIARQLNCNALLKTLLQ